jgi:tRNA G18 (ribose-2'-O)-methylase SpoU
LAISLRSYLAGHPAILTAIEAGEPVQVVLVGADDASPATSELVARAGAAGARIWRGGAGDLRRMSRGPEVPAAMAMLGPSPEADLAGLLARGGITWLVHRAAYPSNVGFIVRTAEVSGAAGVVIDAHWNHDERGRVEHVSMGATRLLPTLYLDTLLVLDQAAALGTPVLAVEDVGGVAPWEVDLRGPVVCIVGGERDGIDAEVLARCAQVVRIPMAGFVPSYNLQAAMSAVASERLRQVLASQNSSPTRAR